MKLYGYWRSSCTWRVRIALAYKEIAHEYQPVHLVRGGGDQNREDYRALNPMRTVPLLEFGDGGRTHRLSQSMAIIEFLEERQPQPPLLPGEPVLRARARMLAETVNSGIQPLQGLAVQQRIQRELGGDERAWSKYWIERGLSALESLVENGVFCVGGALSVADLYLVPQLYNARRYGVEVERFPKLLRIEAQCQTLPAFIRAHPDQQPDAVKVDGRGD